MTPRRAVFWGLAAGSAAAGVMLLLVAAFFSSDRTDDMDADNSAGAAAVHLNPEAAPPEPSPRSRLKKVDVDIYQRGPYDEVALVAVRAEIVHFKAIEDRVRQVVDHVLAGVPNDLGAVSPVPEGVACREVYVDGKGTAWIDLDGSTTDKVVGSDEEQSLIATLALSLVRGFDEIARVGVLVDGMPRTTLAGHLDLRRTYTGREWTVIKVDSFGDDATDPNATSDLLDEPSF